MYTKELDYVLSTLETMVNIPSPSGYCHHIIDWVMDEVKSLGYSVEKTHKGNALITIPGEVEASFLVGAHVDTLGALVRSIKSDGKLRFASVGGFAMHSVEGEYCQVHTRKKGSITGTILNTKPSVHVFKEARTQERVEEVMEVRLDKDISTKEEAEALGICVGDFISFDPRHVVTEDGFIKSRHLDDKAGVAVILGLLKYMKEEGVKTHKTIQIMLSTYEEVGHGTAYIPEQVDTVLAIDMGAIGDDLACSEKDVSICVKDASGPYDYHMIGQLKDIADELELSYTMDVYPNYSSDATAAMRGGHDIKAALIGPGIHASHTMERTHKEALINTLNLLIGMVKVQ